MSDYMTVHDTNQATLVLERLIHKGKGILDVCLEQHKNLCMKGFIDCQIEQGGIYLDVVRSMKEYIESEIPKTSDKGRKELLKDLHEYTARQLENFEPGHRDELYGHVN